MYNNTNSEKEIKDLLTPKNDIIFKKLFGKKGNERIVKDFLEAVLDRKIKSVELGKETQLLPDKIDEKIGILDVRATLEDGTSVDIEMQNINYGNITQRVTYYLNLLYAGELSRGKSYHELKKAIAIAILNFNYFDDKIDYHSVWNMREKKHPEMVLDEQEIHFIELPKFLESKVDTQRKIDQWLLFIDYSKKELVKMAKEKNNVLNEAVAQYEYLTGEEDVQRLAFLRRKYELDYKSGLQYATEKGRQEGESRGIKLGEKIGEKRGKEIGEKKAKLSTAKKMKEKGAEVDFIAEVTGLTKEEVEKL